MTAVSNARPCPALRRPSKVNKYNKTNVSQQIQTDKDGDWRWETEEPRRAYKAPETFRLEAFRSIFFFRFFLLQKSSWLGARQTAGRRLREIGRAGIGIAGRHILC